LSRKRNPYLPGSGFLIIWGARTPEWFQGGNHDRKFVC